MRVIPVRGNQIIARSTKFKINSAVTTQRIGWISFACFFQILVMQ